MEKGFGDEFAAAAITNSSDGGGGGSNSDSLLKQVSKNSHKISKPVRKHFPLPAGASSINSFLEPDQLHPHPGQSQPQSQQPPVYNIKKSDFRDVVQQLTGSLTHDCPPAQHPPVLTHPRPPSSRLQRIRPPPLSQIGNRPPQLTQVAPGPQNRDCQRGSGLGTEGQGLPPLPPLPPVHAAAESPISAYMRGLQNNSFSGAPSAPWYGAQQTGPRPYILVSRDDLSLRPPVSPQRPNEPTTSAFMRTLCSSPLYRSSASQPGNPVSQPISRPVDPVSRPMSQPGDPVPQQMSQPTLVEPQQQHGPPDVPSSGAPASPYPMIPVSPIPFGGCLPSPISMHGMMSPNFTLSPHQLPMSPTPTLSSPRWEEM